MPYPADFVDSHRQHWTDAELLYRNDRWLNADQLYGLCAECGLKAIMRRSGMLVGRLGIPSGRRTETTLTDSGPSLPLSFKVESVDGICMSCRPATRSSTGRSTTDMHIAATSAEREYNRTARQLATFAEWAIVPCRTRRCEPALAFGRRPTSTDQRGAAAPDRQPRRAENRMADRTGLAARPERSSVATRSCLAGADHLRARQSGTDRSTLPGTRPGV